MRVPAEGGAPKKKKPPVRKTADHHPPKPPAPLPDPIWRQAGVFTTNLGAFPDTKQKAAYDAGIRWVAVLLDPVADPGAEREQQELRLKMAELKRAGLTVVGWAPAYHDTEESAQRAVALVKEFGLAGWIVNGEAWWEGANAALGPRWLAEWQRLGAPVPLALSCLSSNTNRWARDFLYKPWIDARCAIMPQVYGNTDHGFTVENMRATLQLGQVPLSLLAPTFGVYPTGLETPWADYATWRGPHSYYLGEQISLEEYRTQVKGG